MRLSFSVSTWAAWAPGLTSNEAWLAWARDPKVPVGKDTPPLTEVPAMQRRRVEKMGRLAFQVAQWAQGESKGSPLIFASRHGDVGRSKELLESLAKNEPLSPTSFALSVHNAIGAQYSIIRQDRAPVSAISNGRYTLEAAVLEAVTQLAETDEVLLVAYEASVPEFYEKWLDEPQSDFAFAWKLKKGDHFSLSLRTRGEGRGEGQSLPNTLEVFKFFLNESVKEFTTDTWSWSRPS
ncbi:MAG: beta-ketoacyl synthase chain length factor [Archangium sp.]